MERTYVTVAKDLKINILKPECVPTTRTYHDTNEHDWFRVQGPLWECRSSRARRFWATLLLRTIRIRSCCTWSVSGVAVMINKTKQNKTGYVRMCVL